MQSIFPSRVLWTAGPCLVRKRGGASGRDPKILERLNTICFGVAIDEAVVGVVHVHTGWHSAEVREDPSGSRSEMVAIQSQGLGRHRDVGHMVVRLSPKPRESTCTVHPAPGIGSDYSVPTSVEGRYLDRRKLAYFPATGRDRARRECRRRLDRDRRTARNSGTIPPPLAPRCWSSRNGCPGCPHRSAQDD